MQCIFFQRNVTCTVHCNRHILSAVNFHNRHTDDDRCTVEMCLLKFKKLHYFKKLLRSWPFQEIRITKVPSITDSGTPLVNDWNHVFPGTLADAWRSWLLNLAASAIIATAVTSGLCLKHNVVDRLEDSIQYCYLTTNYLIFGTLQRPPTNTSLQSSVIINIIIISWKILFIVDNVFKGFC